MGNMIGASRGPGGDGGGDVGGGEVHWPNLEVTWEDFQMRRRVRIDCGEEEENQNGLELSGVIVPETVLEYILSFVEPEDILPCNLVCRAWKDVIVRKSYWKQWWDAKGWDWSLVPPRVRDKPPGWCVLHAQLRHEIVTKNYVSNHSGEGGFNGWNILRNGGDRWRVETEPEGCDPLPDDPFFGEVKAAFVSSFEWASKKTVIDLWAMGLTPPVMTACLPFEIECSQMITSRWDCGGMYRWSLRVLDPNQHEIMEYDASDSFHARSEWETISHSFQFKEEHADKMDEVRYILFSHDGKDNQFWKGHYGTKFARARVQFRFSV